MLEKLRRHFPILLLTAGHGAVDLYVGLLAILAPGMAAYLDIPVGDLVILVGAAALLNNVFQMIAGWVMGTRNLTWILWAGASLSVLPAFMGYATGYYSLAALVLLGAIGTGGYHPEAALASHDASGDKYYLGVPLFMAGGAIVYAVGTPLSIYISGRFGFPALAWFALPGLAVGLLFLLQYRETRKKHPSIVIRPRSKRVTRAGEGRMSFWPLLAVAICFGVANGLFISILASHYDLVFGSGGDAARENARMWSGWVLMILGISASLCSFLWGSLAKRHGFYLVTVISQLAAFPLFAIMAFPPTPFIGFLVTIPLSIFSPVAVYPVAVTLVRDAVGLTQGLRTSLTMGGTSGLSSLAVMIAGVLLRRGVASSHLILFVAACSLGAALLGLWQLMAARKKGADMPGTTIRGAVVLSVDSRRLLVRVDQGDREDCGGCRSCAMKSLCRGRDAGHLDLELPAPASAPRPGDRVRVAYHEPNAALAALVMFVPALAGLFLGGFVAYGFFEGDTAFLLGCGIGFALGLGATFLATRLSPVLSTGARLAESGE